MGKNTNQIATFADLSGIDSGYYSSNKKCVTYTTLPSNFTASGTANKCLKYSAISKSSSSSSSASAVGLWEE